MNSMRSERKKMGAIGDTPGVTTATASRADASEG
jgi:hypothetical protein